MYNSGWEIASHGYRWIDLQNTDEKTEKDDIVKTVKVHQDLFGKSPIGIYQGKPNSNSRLRIYDVESGKMRRKGIAKSLTMRAEKIAKSFAYKNIYLFVNTENIPAIRLYKSRGYKSVDDIKNTTKIIVKNNRFRNIECTNLMMKKRI